MECAVALTLPPDQAVFEFDEFRVDCEEHRLLRDGAELPLEPKAYSLLVALLKHAGHVVGRDKLLDEVWEKRFVTPSVLTRAIGQIRTALHDHADAPRYVQTVHTHGYRFIGKLRAAAQDTPTRWRASSSSAQAPGVAEAKDSYAVALRYLWERTPASLEEALRRFTECTRLDPRNARAHAKIAQCCLLLFEYGDWDTDAAFARARESIARAQTLEPFLAEAYAAQGLLELELNNYQVATCLLQLAVDLDATLLQPRIWLGTAMSCCARLADGERVLLDAADVHSGNVVVLAGLSLNMALQGHWESSEQLLAGIRRVNSGYLELYWQMAWLRLQQGRLAEAWTILLEAEDEAGKNAWTHRCLCKLASMCALPEPGAPSGLITGSVACELHTHRLWLRGEWSAAVDWLSSRQAPAIEACLWAAWLGHSLACAGRPVEALAKYDSAFPLDPSCGDSLKRVWDFCLGLGERANHASLLDRDHPRRQPIIDGLHAQIRRLHDGGMRLPSLDYHASVLHALDGNASACLQALDRALDGGFRDAFALSRELAWRSFPDASGLDARRERMGACIAAERAKIGH